ncbi:type II secretion system F family protein [Streptomyces sp. URMC 123]|uniref:type II secretion system F family protein n=1 Tax=Streptomyces sp. URMC 123 TaxID=3423403 RepID=UPI003F1AEFF0
MTEAAVTDDLLHRLGATVAAALAVALWTARAVRAARRKRAVRRRLVGLLGVAPAQPGRRLRLAVARRSDRLRPALRRGSAAAAAAAVGWALVGGTAGCLLGAVLAHAVWRWWPRRPARARPAATARAVARELPLAGDLLAACLIAGAGPRAAAEAVGGSLDGPVGRRLAQAAAELRLGGAPDAAWGRVAALPGARGLARCLQRAWDTGAPAAEPMARLAADLRADRAREAAARARKAGVLATAPLGLCFLPAFLVLGVAPVLIGMASGLLARN